MRRSGILLMALAIVTCLSMGCSAKREEASGYNTEVGRENTVISKNSIFKEEEKFVVPELQTAGYAFTVMDGGDIVVVNTDGIMQRITPSGEISELCKGVGDVVAVCSNGDKVIAYDMGKSEFFSCDVNTKNVVVIADGFHAEEILEMQILGEYLYVLIVPLDYHGYMAENDYLNLGETMYRFSLKDGKKEKIEINNCMDFTVTKENKLVYYAYSENTYVLNEYDPESKETKTLYDMMKQYQTGYVSAIIYTGEMFGYAELDTPAVYMVSLSNGEKVNVREHEVVVRGCEFQEKEGILFCRSYSEDAEEHFTELRLSDLK